MNTRLYLFSYVFEIRQSRLYTFFFQIIDYMFPLLNLIFFNHLIIYLGGRIEFKISSVCWAALASTGASFCLAGGFGTGPVACGGAGLAFKALA